MAGRYTAPDTSFSNQVTNSPGSQYSALFGQPIDIKVAKLTNRLIFDASPQQFYDLKLLNMRPPTMVGSDEFFFQEMNYQRSPLIATSSIGGVTSPTTQTFSVASTKDISVNTIITYPNNTKGTITDVNTATMEVTVSPYSTTSLPAVTSGDSFALLSPVQADGAEGFKNFFRADTIERFNFIQLMTTAMRFGKVELTKYEKSGEVENFISMNKQAMLRQYRISLSNAFWNGERGQVVLDDGTVAKTTQGLFPSMVEAGSPSAAATTATLKAAFQDVVLSSEFGDYGATRFAFMPNDIHLALSEIYKTEKTRYRPADDVADLMLQQIRLGGSNIVLVPYNRFTDGASFPASFANKIFILDMKNIQTRQIIGWGEIMGETKVIEDGIPKFYKESFLSTSFGVEFNNPLACGFLDVTL